MRARGYQPWPLGYFTTIYGFVCFIDLVVDHIANGIRALAA
jgi:hypothetical protein